jgi:hypothetical protein
MHGGNNVKEHDKDHILELIFDPASGEEFVGTEYIVTLCPGVQRRPTNGPDKPGAQEYSICDNCD